MVISDRMRGIAEELTTAWLAHPATLLDEVDSTNRWLKAQFLAGDKHHGAVVWADAQTAGRGRLGRLWESPPGTNIYTSLLWQPPKDRLTGVLSLVAGVAVVRAVAEYTGLDARMKWPNDGVIHGRKFCGILVEAGIDPKPWAVVGIGINVSSPVMEQYPHAVSLEAEAGHALLREDLWLGLMRHLEIVYDDWMREGDEWATQVWAAVNATLGQVVQVERPGEEPWVGVAESVDGDGGLWVRAENRREKIIAGEVHLRLADGRYAPDSF